VRAHGSSRHRIEVTALAATMLLALLLTGDALAAPLVRQATETATRVSSCKGTITACTVSVLAPAGGTDGVFLRQVGGSVLASQNQAVAFEPASSIKPVIALYALMRVQHGSLALTTRIPKISTKGGTEDCPPSTIKGAEALGTALQQMLQVSDNNRTRELMQYFGVSKLNAFATSIGLKHTHFQSSARSPGFNVIGCSSFSGSGFPSSLDGNTMSLGDMATLWSRVVALPAPYSSAFFQLAAGREMADSVGYDFTGLWPDVVGVAHDVAPPGLSAAQLNSFIDHVSFSAKGGSYDWYICTTGSRCERAWASFGFVASLPSCSGSVVKQTELLGGDFVSDADSAYGSDPAAFGVVGPAIAQLLQVPIEQSLSGWKTCAPKSLPTLHVHGSRVTSPKTVGIATSLATIQDSDTTDVSSDMQGTISWGDGMRSAATISGASGSFQVHGWHAYATGGSRTVTVTVTSEATHRSSIVKFKLVVS
jgi:hypothetical protein